MDDTRLKTLAIDVMRHTANVGEARRKGSIRKLKLSLAGIQGCFLEAMEAGRNDDLIAELKRRGYGSDHKEAV